MKKILGIAAILILTAGISHAGDSFSIVIGPHGFGFFISGDHGRWQPQHDNYRADWRPAPIRRPFRHYRQGNHWDGRQPLPAPRYRNAPPRQRPWTEGDRGKGTRNRRR